MQAFDGGADAVTCDYFTEVTAFTCGFGPRFFLRGVVGPYACEK